MPGTAIGLEMNAGYPGTYARNADCVTSNRVVLTSDSAGPSFGDPVLLNSDNTVSAGLATLTAANFYGIAAREVKTPLTYLTADSLGSYAPGDPCDVLRRGTVSVICRVGTPTAGGAVYVRTVLGTSPPTGAVVGGFETAAASNTGGTTVLLTGVNFETGYMDANKVTEIRLKTINL